MCILPKSLHTLVSALDTKESGLDLKGLSQTYAPVLTLRGKLSRWQTWLIKLKRAYWMQLLSTRTLPPSLTENFTRSWVDQILSAHLGFRANLTPVQVSGRVLQMNAGFSIALQMDLLSCDPAGSLSKTSPGSSPAACPAASSASITSSPDWRGSDTKWRIIRKNLSSRYAVRQNVARLIQENGCSSLANWQTIRGHEVGDYQNQPNGTQTKALTGQAKEGLAWPTPRASEADKSPKDNNRDSPCLSHLVKQEWPTPRAGKTSSEEQESWQARADQGGGSTPPLELAVKMWATPRSSPNENRQTQLTPSQIKGEHCLSLAAQAVTGHWPTPSARDVKGHNGEEHMTSRERPHMDQLPNAVIYQQRNWPTPTTPRPHDNEETAGQFLASQNQKDLVWAVGQRGPANSSTHGRLQESFVFIWTCFKYPKEMAWITTLLLKLSHAALNAEWAAQLMNIPRDWLLISEPTPPESISSELLETVACQPQLNLPGDCSVKD
jgi:hypothetical protein